MTRSAAPTFGLVVAVALVAAVSSSDAIAGWRSADRRALEDDEVVEEPYGVEEPYPGEVVDDDRPMLYRDYRDEPVRQAPAGAATQPYWGTMQPYWGTTRPYWNSGSAPPRVIRQPGLRTAPLKK